MTDEKIDELTAAIVVANGIGDTAENLRAIVREYLQPQPEISERTKLLAMMAAAIYGGNSENFDSGDAVVQAQSILTRIEGSK